ncbi:MAG: hypothetical protein ACREOG_15410 [Gemmatimonadaceae bacterium]
MQSTTLVTMWLVRIVGIWQIVSGILIWMGRGATLVPLHMNTGYLVILGLWILAVLAWRATSKPAVAIVALLYGLLVIALGMTQARLLVGPMHWVIQVLHLVLGVAALGMADRFADRVRKARPVQ